MSFLDRLFSRNSTNRLKLSSGFFSLNFGFEEKLRAADIYLWCIFNRIFGGLKNVVYTCENEHNKSLTTFLSNNLLQLVWLLWEYGYMVVDVDAKGNYYIPDYSLIRLNGEGAVSNYPFVLYSEPYQFRGLTDIVLIRETLKSIGVYKSAEAYLTETFGAVGIMTGKGMPVNPTEKEAFERAIKEGFGIQKDKRQIIVSSMPLDFSTMDFHTKDLELREKINDAYSLLCNYFNIPIDLVFGRSTYANQEQAFKDFYKNCISPLAEKVLELGRYIIKRDPHNLTPSSALTFRIDNVEEMRDDHRIVDTEYVRNLLDNIKISRELNLPTIELENELNNYYQNMMR